VLVFLVVNLCHHTTEVVQLEALQARMCMELMEGNELIVYHTRDNSMSTRLPTRAVKVKGSKVAFFANLLFD